MKLYKEGYYTGERALYNISDAEIVDSVFTDGESPLKECKNLKIENTTFEYKYPLWYCNNVLVNNSVFLEMSRSGIWYTNNITINNSLIDSPKQFRRCNNVKLNNVDMPKAQEMLWGCDGVELNNCTSVGDYFLMNSKNVKINNLRHAGNYVFDGVENMEIDNTIINTKDSFWNSKNVIVRNSKIIGEYIGWNSQNLTFINCTIESEQGFCYIDGLKLVNCKVINTNLAFEKVSNLDIDVTTKIDSVKNPISGTIKAKAIGEIIMDKDIVDPNNTKIITEE